MSLRAYGDMRVAIIATDLLSGPSRLRKEYIDAAEDLLRKIDPDNAYPSEYIVYRITGYRPSGEGDTGMSISGDTLIEDLPKLILDICDSFDLHTVDYGQRAYNQHSLAKRFGVSVKTIQRWRKQGLVCRRLIFPDGKKRIGFLDSSVQYYVEIHGGQVSRSRLFTHLSASERASIITQAKKMVRSSSDICLTEVAKRLATKTERAAETIRHTIHAYDQNHPDTAIFPSSIIKLTDLDKRQIYSSFMSGVSMSTLTKKFQRSRGTIYRVFNEIRAKKLLHRCIAFIPNPDFALPDADENILSPRPTSKNPEPAPAQLRAKPPANIPPYLRALYDVPLLSAKQEQSLFQRYNYLKYKADKLRGLIDLTKIHLPHLRQIEAMLLQANVVKNRIIRANLRLVVSIAKKHLRGPKNLFELISDGNVALLRSVEKFDYGRGFRFSTYSSWAIMRSYARSVPKERYQLDRFSTGHEDILDVAAGLQSYNPNENSMSELRESIEVLLSQLSPRERTIIIDHYGLDETADSQTFDQLGNRLGISKERVRQIEFKALKKLRRIKPQASDLLS